MDNSENHQISAGVNRLEDSPIEVTSLKLPREYYRQWTDLIDKRFALILLASFIVHFATVMYFSLNPPKHTISAKDIEAIQQQYVNFILDKKTEELEIEKDNETLVNGETKEPVKKRYIEGSADRSTGSTATGVNQGGATLTGVDRASSMGNGSGSGRTGLGSAENRSVSGDVGNKGLLGLLSSDAATASGQGVSDMLSEVDARGGDLDKVLGNVDGIKVADGSTRGSSGGKGEETGQGSHSVKGERSSKADDINVLISGRGTAKSKDIERIGNIVVSEIAEVANDEGIKTESRNPDEVSEIVNNHNSTVQYCYQRELKRNPELKGKLVVRFTIGSNGSVKEAQIISSTLNNESVERCILNRIRRWDDFGVIDASKRDAVFRQVYTFGY